MPISQPGWLCFRSNPAYRPAAPAPSTLSFILIPSWPQRHRDTGNHEEKTIVIGTERCHLRSSRSLHSHSLCSLCLCGELVSGNDSGEAVQLVEVCGGREEHEMVTPRFGVAA